MIRDRENNTFYNGGYTYEPTQELFDDEGYAMEFDSKDKCIQKVEELLKSNLVYRLEIIEAYEL